MLFWKEQKEKDQTYSPDFFFLLSSVPQWQNQLTLYSLDSWFTVSRWQRPTEFYKILSRFSNSVRSFLYSILPVKIFSLFFPTSIETMLIRKAHILYWRKKCACLKGVEMNAHNRYESAISSSHFLSVRFFFSEVSFFFFSILEKRLSLSDIALQTSHFCTFTSN